MDINIRKKKGYSYIAEGDGHVLLLLHGLFGALSNWNAVLEHFSQNYRVIIPLIPIYEGKRVKPSVEGLTDFVEEFVNDMELNDFTVIGNSLGGHLALTYTLRHPDKVRHMVLTGSSGLFEAGMGAGFPRRGDQKYLRERIQFTFYDPATATDDLVAEVTDIVNNTPKAIRVVKIARSAQRMNMAEQIITIQTPTLLIWGLNDNITPSYVAHEFEKLIPNSELHFIDKCGHAAMMERPEAFIKILQEYLARQMLLVA